MTTAGSGAPAWRRRTLLLLATVVGAIALAVAVAWSRTPTTLDQTAVDLVGHQTYDDGDIQFDYPLGWDLYRIQTVTLGFGQTDAILGNRPFPVACRGVQDDINCFFQRSLEPGTISIEIGSRSLTRGTIFDFPPPDPQQHAIIARGVLGGMPAVKVDYGDMGPDDFYHVDDRAEWTVARPDSPSRAHVLVASIREPGLTVLRAQLETIIASFRYDKPLLTLPSDPSDLAAAGRKAAVAGIRTVGLEAEEALAVGPRDRSGYDCFEAAIDHPVTVPITFGSGSALGGTVDMACNVAVEPMGNTFWKVTLTAVSGVGSSRPGAVYRQILWLTAGGDVAGSSSDDVVPGARLPDGPIDRAAATRALATALALGQGGPDFYACFSPEPEATVRGTITTGPDGTTPYHGIAVTCTSRVTAAPDRNVYIVTLTASWSATADHPAGGVTATYRVGADNSMGDPEISGDALP